MNFPPYEMDLHRQQIQLFIQFLLIHINNHPKFITESEISNLRRNIAQYYNTVSTYTRTLFDLEFYITQAALTLYQTTLYLSTFTSTKENALDTYNDLQSELDKHSKEMTKLVSKFINTHKIHVDMNTIQNAHRTLMTRTNKGDTSIITHILRHRSQALYFILEAIAHVQNSVHQIHLKTQNGIQLKTLIEQRKILTNYRQRAEVAAPPNRLPTNMFLMRFE